MANTNILSTIELKCDYTEYSMEKGELWEWNCLWGELSGGPVVAGGLKLLSNGRLTISFDPIRFIANTQFQLESRKGPICPKCGGK